MTKPCDPHRFSTPNKKGQPQKVISESRVRSRLRRGMKGHSLFVFFPHTAGVKGPTSAFSSFRMGNGRGRYTIYANEAGKQIAGRREDGSRSTHTGQRATGIPDGALKITYFFCVRYACM